METNDQNPYEAPVHAGEMKSAGAQAELGSRLTRLGAAILDTIILLAITIPIMLLTGYFQRAMAQEVSIVEIGLQTLLGIVIYMLLHGYLLATRGQSIGKLIVGVRIVDYNTNQILPLGKLVGLRLLPIWVASIIPCIGPLFCLVDVLFIFSEERRCIHDLIAGTKVVQV